MSSNVVVETFGDGRTPDQVAVELGELAEGLDCVVVCAMGADDDKTLHVLWSTALPIKLYGLLTHAQIRLGQLMEQVLEHVEDDDEDGAA